MEYGEYAALYPEGPEESQFQRLDWEARRIMDRATTGVDGVHKLSAAPPTEPSAALAVAESVSFAAPPSAGLSQSQREALYSDTVRDYLSGVADANGVHLLYMGRYPRRGSPA